MATSSGLQRVAAINATIARQGQAAPNPMAGQNAVTLSNQGSANPADRYSPSATKAEPTDAELGLKPNSKVSTANLTSIDTNQPNPQTTQINPPTTKDTGTIMATPGQVSAVQQATQQVQSLAERYKQGLATAKASGTEVPNTAGAAAPVISTSLPPVPQTQPTTTPNVDNFYNPQVNPNLQQSTQDIIDFIYPSNVRTDLFNQMSKIQGEQNILAAEQLELMDIKRVMSGTEDDIRSEIQATGGLGTDSQVQALTVGRNKTLLKQATFIQDQMQYQKSLIDNDTTLLNFEKDMASTQATQRMSILQYQQTNQNNMMNAARDTYKTLLSSVGAQGLYNALSRDPQQLANAEAIMGLGQGGLANLASTPKAPEYGFTEVGGVLYRTDKATGTATPIAGGGGGGGGDAQSWATNIQNGTASLSDVPANMKNQVSTLLASQPKQMGGQATELVGNINALLASPDIKYATGITGAMPSWMTYGSSAFTIKKQADQIKNMISLKNRQQLKGQGQVSDFEGRMLASAATTLSSGLTPEAFSTELKKVRGITQLMNGQTINVKIKDPSTGDFIMSTIDEKALEQAINDGAVIEYQ